MITHTPPQTGLAAAPPREEPPPDDAAEIFDRVISRLFLVGLLLQSTESLPAESVRQAVTDAVEHLDEMIREMRDVVFAPGA
jgi:hypothetical protein